MSVEFSGLMRIPKEKRKKAQKIVERERRRTAKRLKMRMEALSEFLVDYEHGLWFLEDSYADIEEAVEPLARALVDELELDEPFFLEWAFTSEDELRLTDPGPGGGAFLIARGRPTFWIVPSALAEEKLKEWERR